MPTQKPCSAAMTGLSSGMPAPGSARISVLVDAMLPVRAISLMSEPAQNAFSPEPVRIATRTCGSLAISCQISPSRSFAGTSSAFMTCGRSMVTTATPFARFSRMTDMRVPLAVSLCINSPTHFLFEHDLSRKPVSTFRDHALERAGIAAAVDQQVLSGNVARMRRAEKGEIGAELFRPPIAPGRTGGGALLPDLIERLAKAIEHALDVALLRVAVEDAGQDVVDRDIAMDGLPGEACHEADKACARAVRQAKLELRDLHAARRDIDDAAKAARHHAVDGQAHHLDRREHHRIERLDPGLARPAAEIAGRGTVRVIEQNVGLRAGGERRRTSRLRGDVGRCRRHAHAGGIADLRGCALQHVAGACDDGDIDTLLCDGHRRRLA